VCTAYAGGNLRPQRLLPLEERLSYEARRQP
jgi:hypothetical protein